MTSMLMMIDARMNQVLAEMVKQEDRVSASDDGSVMSTPEQHRFLRSLIDHNESGEAFESMICALESGTYTLSGSSAVALVELALLFGYKTDRDEDAVFRVKPQ